MVAGRARERTADVVRHTAAALTRPLPAHVADYREPARTALLVAALALTLGVLWLPHPEPVAVPGVLLLAVSVAATAGAGIVRSAQPLLNRFGWLIVIVQISVLVWLTGGEQSVFHSLYIMLLLYAGLFYSGAMLLATGVVVAIALLLPFAYGTVPVSYLTEVAVLMVVSALTSATVHHLVRRIRHAAQTDGLTGLVNHATFWHLLRIEHERMLRFGRQYSVLLLDVDHFKQVNDRWGHPAGDEVLREIGELLHRRVRAIDIAARYGGEEFAIIVPETDRDAAVELARDLRRRVAGGRLTVPVTVSVGVACAADPFGVSAESVLAAADAALYAAKRAGRDHVAVALPGTDGDVTSVR